MCISRAYIFVCLYYIYNTFLFLQKLSRPQRAVAKKSTSIASSTILSNVPKIKEEDQTPEVMEPAGNMVKSRVVVCTYIIILLYI